MSFKSRRKERNSIVGDKFINNLPSEEIEDKMVESVSGENRFTDFLFKYDPICPVVFTGQGNMENPYMLYHRPLRYQSMINARMLDEGQLKDMMANNQGYVALATGEIFAENMFNYILNSIWVNFSSVINNGKFVEFGYDKMIPIREYLFNSLFNRSVSNSMMNIIPLDQYLINIKNLVGIRNLKKMYDINGVIEAGNFNFNNPTSIVFSATEKANTELLEKRYHETGVLPKNISFMDNALCYAYAMIDCICENISGLLCNTMQYAINEVVFYGHKFPNIQRFEQVISDDKEFKKRFNIKYPSSDFSLCAATYLSELIFVDIDTTLRVIRADLYELFKDGIFNYSVLIEEKVEISEDMVSEKLNEYCKNNPTYKVF